jgi:hypothetical protein
MDKATFLADHRGGMRAGLMPDLLCISRKGRPKVDCPKWFRDGLEQADLAYQTPRGWFLTPAGQRVLDGGEVPLD